MAEHNHFEHLAGTLLFIVFLFIVGAFLQVATSLINVWAPETAPAGVKGEAALAIYAGVAVGLALVIAALLGGWSWLTWRRWLARDPRAHSHARILAIVVAIIGLVGIVGGALQAPELRWDGAARALLSFIAILADVTSVLTLLMGIRILRRINDPVVKAQFAVRGRSPSPA